MASAQIVSCLASEFLAKPFGLKENIGENKFCKPNSNLRFARKPFTSNLFSSNRKHNETFGNKSFLNLRIIKGDSAFAIGPSGLNQVSDEGKSINNEKNGNGAFESKKKSENASDRLNKDDSNKTIKNEKNVETVSGQTMGQVIAMSYDPRSEEMQSSDTNHLSQVESSSNLSEVIREGQNIGNELADLSNTVSNTAQETINEIQSDVSAVAGKTGDVAQDIISDSGRQGRRQMNSILNEFEHTLDGVVEQSDSAISRISDQTNKTASVIEAAALKVTEQAITGQSDFGDTLVEALGQTVGSLGKFGQVIGESTGILNTETSQTRSMERNSDQGFVSVEEGEDIKVERWDREGIKDDLAKDENESEKEDEKEDEKRNLENRVEVGEENGDEIESRGESDTDAEKKKKSGEGKEDEKREEDKEKKEGGKEKEESDEEKDPFKNMKVFVAGTGGRTGRKVCEKLVQKGVGIRALVRGLRSKRYLSQLNNVTVIDGDLYKYQGLKSAIGESNAIICTIGIRPNVFDPFGPFKEFTAVQNLISAAVNKGNIKRFILVTSLGVSQLSSPFNFFWGLLFWKKQQEEALQRSGLNYTIIRPGFLKSSNDANANIVMRKADSFYGGSITFGQVADLCVEALVLDSAKEKVVEVIAQRSASYLSVDELFGSV